MVPTRMPALRRSAMRRDGTGRNLPADEVAERAFGLLWSSEDYCSVQPTHVLEAVLEGLSANSSRCGSLFYQATVSAYGSTFFVDALVASLAAVRTLKLMVISQLVFSGMAVLNHVPRFYASQLGYHGHYTARPGHSSRLKAGTLVEPFRPSTATSKCSRWICWRSRFAYSPESTAKARHMTVLLFEMVVPGTILSGEHQRSCLKHI